MFSTEIRGTISFPEIRFQEELQRIADSVFIPALKGYIVKGMDIQENAYPPLEASTLKAKARKGQRPDVLIATGTLAASFIAYARGDKEVVITILGDRKQIGGYLQNEGIRSKRYGKRFFNFFGISDEMEKKAIRFMEKKVKEYTKSAK